MIWNFFFFRLQILINQNSEFIPGSKIPSFLFNLNNQMMMMFTIDISISLKRFSIGNWLNKKNWFFIFHHFSNGIKSHETKMLNDFFFHWFLLDSIDWLNSIKQPCWCHFDGGLSIRNIHGLRWFFKSKIFKKRKKWWHYKGKWEWWGKVYGKFFFRKSFL